MAGNTQDQTQYASDNGDVPIASKGDITRENPFPPSNYSGGMERANPYGGPDIQPPPPPPPSPATQALAAAGSAAAPPNTPLSTSGYAGQQIGSAEARKDTIEREANNLSKGQEDIARINREAEAEQRRMLFGNPEELLKAQQSLQAAQALPPNDPNKQLQIVQSQDAIMKNTGARPLLMKAMEDQEIRDKALMAKINAAAAEQIDPDRYWNNKSTGGKILAGIGLVLSGMGGGMTGSNRNLALEQMNKAIDDDMNAQRHHIDNSWKAIATEHGINQDSFNRELHRQTWEADFRKAAYENIKMQLGQSAATTQSETVKNNAVNMIQTLTDEQAKIRNQQYNLAVQAQQAELNRMRALSKDADAAVQKLVEGGKYTYEEANGIVYDSPRYRQLIGAGMAPPEASQKARLKIEFSRDLEKQKAQAKLLGIPESDPRYQKIIGVVTEDPKYAPIFQTPGGNVVPDVRIKEAQGGGTGEERQKQINDRTVNVNQYDANGKIIGSQPMLATNKNAADAFHAYQDASPQFKSEYENLKAAAKSGNVAQYEQSRAILIDLFPKFKFGSHSAPTDSQKATAEEIIPTYTHWYSLGLQSRRDEKITGIERLIEDREKTIHRDTFGSEATTPTTPGGAGGTPKAGNIGRDGKPYGATVK